MYKEISIKYVWAKGKDGTSSYPIFVTVVQTCGDTEKVLFSSAIYVSEDLCDVPAPLKDACKDAPSEYYVNKQKDAVVAAFA